MPAFSFEALDAAGQTRKGTIDADSPKAARSLLRAQALVPLAVEALASNTAAGEAPSLSQRLLTRPVFNSNQLTIWTRQLAGLIVSGLPLERALMIASVLLVRIVELVNSAIEATVDRISLENHALAKRAKDIGSAAVLISLINVLVIWGLVLFG